MVWRGGVERVLTWGRATASGGLTSQGGWQPHDRTEKEFFPHPLAGEGAGVCPPSWDALLQTVCTYSTYIPLHTPHGETPSAARTTALPAGTPIVHAAINPFVCLR